MPLLCSKKEKEEGKKRKRKIFLEKSNYSYDPSQFRFLNKEDILRLLHFLLRSTN